MLFVLWQPAVSQHRVDSLRNALSKASEVNKLKLLNDIAEEYDVLISNSNDENVNAQYLEMLNISTNEALKAAENHSDNIQIARAHKYRGHFFYHSQNYEEMFQWHAKALELYKASNDMDAYTKQIYSIGIIHSGIDPSMGAETLQQIYGVDVHKVDASFYYQSLFELGINYFLLGSYNRSLEIFTDIYNANVEIGDTTMISASLSALGVTAFTSGDYNKALEYNMEVLKIREKQNEKEAIAIAMLNIGNVHKAIKSWETAKVYYLNALKIFEELNQKKNMATCFNNIGIIYEEQKQFDEAEAYYTESLKLSEELRDSLNIMSNYINLGSIQKNTNKLQSALSSYRKALRIAERRGDKQKIALISNNIGDVYFVEDRFEESLPFFFSSLQIAKELGIKDIIALNYKSLSFSYEQLGNTSEALKYFKQFFDVRDELINEGNQKAIAEMQTKYDTEKKEQQITLMNKDMELQDAKIKRDMYVKISMGVGITFVFIFLVFVYIQLQDKKKKNILLAKQKEEIECQRDLLAKQKQEITDSIHYARRIQKAILPPEHLSAEIMPEHFILFKPRDIVSGDFYWIASQSNKTFVVAADCTGHGVPGAFMSMLGVAFLNEIVMYHKRTDSDVILNELRKLVKTTLGQSGQKEEAKDGMDISLCVINWVQKTIQYSGAYNPLFYFRNGEFFEIKADKMPIGVYIKDHEPFTKHEMKIEPGDTFYIFSDGYVDQFGGEDGRKFMTKNFKLLLADIQDKSMEEQHTILEDTTLKWRGHHEQVDDVSIVGFRFSSESLMI
jgi:serine phosphatase RsbU (regulator of sigma subunit)